MTEKRIQGGFETRQYPDRPAALRSLFERDSVVDGGHSVRLEGVHPFKRRVTDTKTVVTPTKPEISAVLTEVSIKGIFTRVEVEPPTVTVSCEDVINPYVFEVNLQTGEISKNLCKPPVSGEKLHNFSEDEVLSIIALSIQRLQQDELAGVADNE